MPRYVALLRGINVGGKNVIKMAELRACFEAQGFADVITYIQSGNVVFSGPEGDRGALTARVESALTEAFNYESRVFLRSHREMQAIATGAPTAFGREPDSYRYDVLFLRDHLRAADALASVSVRDGVDRAYAGDSVLYFSRLIARAGQSHLNRIVGSPVYQDLTIRNWNTTVRLLALMEDAGS
jgi:uncharacterized protein (DUF1697 family)